MEKTNITTIGKIILDERFYEGVDRYSDGDIEDELLKMVETHDRKAFRKLTEEKNNWPVLYHLSPFRENIAEWIPIQKNEKVLEVGSGCGAITGALAKKAGKVVGVDLSKKRSTINANRLKDADNVELRIGNFLDVEKDLPDDFDVIMLIGVFEYAAGYIGGEHPYEEFLKILKKHLKSGGRMFIAIENLFGLKYFAGCREDHAGRYFEGIEGYPKKGVARTFSENGLKRIFESVGLPQYRFYYPYPDYKFPHTIFSKECFPKKGELHDNIRNFDRERMILFDETKAFDTIIDDGEFPLFSNSYLVVIGEAPDIAMVKYSVDRDEAYGICTTIEGLKTQKKVIKRAMSEKAVGHIDNIEKAYRALTERFAGSGISFNRLERIDDKRIELEFVEGITLEELLDQKLQRGDKEGFLSLFDRYSGIVSYHTEAAVCDYDLIFQNIIVKGDVWTVIDYEWTFFESMDPKEIILRALWCYIQGNENRKIVKEWCCPGTDFGDVVRKEQEFQKKVQGGHPALSEIRHAIGKAATSLDYMLSQSGDVSGLIQIYENRGNGFSEGESYRIAEVSRTGKEISFDLHPTRDVKQLRIDPGNDPAIVLLREAKWNGTDISERILRKDLVKRDTNGKRIGADGFLFAAADPHFTFTVPKDLMKAGENTLHLTIRLETISQEAAIRLG